MNGIIDLAEEIAKQVRNAVRPSIGSGRADIVVDLTPSYDVNDLHTTKITIVPGDKSKVRATRGSSIEEVTLGIVVQKKIRNEQEEVSELLRIVDDINNFFAEPVDYYSRISLGHGWKLKSATISKPYDVTHLEEARVFTGSTLLTFIRG